MQWRAEIGEAELRRTGAVLDLLLRVLVNRRQQGRY